MIEENIIGMSIAGKIDPLDAGLSEHHFTNYAYQKVWGTLLHLRSQKLVCDLITTSDILTKNDNTHNWFLMLADIAHNSLSPVTAKGHINKIKLNWRNSEIKKIAGEMSTDTDIDVNHYIKSLMALDVKDKDYLYSFSQAADDALVEIDKVMNGERITIPTGLVDIDKVMGGLHNSDLIIVAARPAMGKTAFMLNVAAANENTPLIFSTEQSRIQAAQRLFSIYGNVPNHKIRTGEIGDEEYAQISTAINRINNCNGFIYDKSGPYMSEIESVARQVKHDHGCTAIYLDYLQRIKHENKNLPKHEQVGDIAMRLKELARELDIPVMALAQVNRKCEERADKRPQMGDIKDSGTIEQEADSILTLYRDEVYDESTQDKNICEIDFKKNRHGGTGLIKTVWNAPTMQFKDLSAMRY